MFKVIISFGSSQSRNVSPVYKLRTVLLSYVWPTYILPFSQNSYTSVLLPLHGHFFLNDLCFPIIKPIYYQASASISLVSLRDQSSIFPSTPCMLISAIPQYNLSLCVMSALGRFITCMIWNICMDIILEIRGSAQLYLFAHQIHI